MVEQQRKTDTFIDLSDDDQLLGSFEEFRVEVLHGEAANIYRYSDLTVTNEAGIAVELGFAEVPATDENPYGLDVMSEDESVRYTLEEFVGGVMHQAPAGEGAIHGWAGERMYSLALADIVLQDQSMGVAMSYSVVEMVVDGKDVSKIISEDKRLAIAMNQDGIVDRVREHYQEYTDRMAWVQAELETELIQAFSSRYGVDPERLRALRQNQDNQEGDN